MHQIKLRFWNKKHSMYEYRHLLNNNGQIHDPCEGGRYPIKDQDNFVIEQFTGLLDKNENPIYEGDILQGFDWNEDYTIRDVPSYKYSIESELSTSCGCCSRIIGWEINSPSEEKIIGNIHENPELLETK